VYKSIEGICTQDSCPQMSAGKNVVYLWADGKKVKKPIELSAPEYIEHLLEWVYGQLSDPTIFPQDDDTQVDRLMSMFTDHCFSVPKELC
jgi:MOB kinase activator 1